DLERMHLWISEHTGLHERFITLPGDDSFLCEARRSLVVGYKAILHRPDFLPEWYDKMQRVYGVDTAQARCGNVYVLAHDMYHQRRDAMIRVNPPADYRLYELNQLDAKRVDPSKILHQEGGIILMKFGQ
ncbi:MAG: hypothetical protein JNL88_01590, partial [Bacteroidia bacterium]|nr:hypothetical protein [Bacteroidia bacterium]